VPYNTGVIDQGTMQEFLESVLIDTNRRQFKLFSNMGDEKTVDCETYDEFMNVFIHVRDKVDEDMIFYKKPLVAS